MVPAFSVSQAERGHEGPALRGLYPQVDAILVGEQPANLTRQRLLDIDLPLRWEEHEELLGLERRGAGLSSA